MIAFSPLVAAQEAKDPGQDTAGIWSFVLENDLFYDTDRRYTNGVRLTYLTPKGDEPPWLRDLALQLPMFNAQSDIRIEYALGQSMYTATNKLLRDPPANDRPYAGWLYGSVGVVARTGPVLDQASLSLGVVGPASLAHETQDFVHRIVNSPLAEGWDTQLKNEPTVQFTYQRSWQSPELELPWDFGIDATPHAGFALGNVFTYGNTGLMLRLGQNLPTDYGPLRVQPSLPGSGYFEKRGAGSIGWYLFAGVDGRAVAHNIFLDGNTFRDSRSVDKKVLVGDAQFGLAVIIDGVRFAYTYVLRTREYDGQNDDDEFGALSVSFRF
ncbi:lipid A deacylase LpxR family protein [uncultured Ferrovibrio sp.]|uniref:lipid A deacylase LpxR family protein n=1 Tax=uncultured Ferrovibrio sp. TaxID=1576913 RepID=UPI002623ED6C|nr:lipid A deacylase LpxR family protein [uncultured Ferrovibrio sp.]